MRVAWMQSVEEREGIFSRVEKLPTRDRANPLSQVRHANFRDLVLRRLAAMPVSRPFAVRRCRLCLYGGVLRLSLVRTVTLAGFVQPAGFIRQ